jgi:hypothetical protein
VPHTILGRISHAPDERRSEYQSEAVDDPEILSLALGRLFFGHIFV